MRRTLKKAVAFLLAVSMLVGTNGIVSAARTEDKETLSYVAIGDSMTNGYGLNGYEVNDVNVNGYLQEVEGSYPVEFRKWLSEYTQKNVELTQLGTSALRAEDVRFLLEYGSEDAYLGDDYTVYRDGQFDNYYNEENCYPKAAEVFQSAVKEADVISIGVGSNNFSTYMTENIGGYASELNPSFAFGGNSFENDYMSLLFEEDEEMKALAVKIHDKVLEMIKDYARAQGLQLGEELKGFSEHMASAAAYTTIGFMQGYEGILDYVYEVNPDAQIIIVNLTNWLDGFEVAIPMDGGTFNVPVGELVSVLYEYANFYMAALPTAYNAEADLEGAEGLEVYYAEVEAEEKVQTLLNDVANGNIKGDYTLLRKCFVTSVNDYVLSMMGTEDITLSDIQEYEEVRKGLEKNNVVSWIKYGMNQERYQTCEMYLGFEQALIDIAYLEAVDGSAFAALMESGALEEAVGKVAATVSEKAGGTNPLFADILTEELQKEEPLHCLLHVFCKFIAGDGIASHPNVEGHATIKNAMAKAYEYGCTPEAQVEEVLNILVDYIDEYIIDLRAENMDEVRLNYEDTLTGEYELNEDSYYIAFGDTVASEWIWDEPYGKSVADAYGIEYTNYGIQGLGVKGLLELFEDEEVASEVETADLITVGFSVKGIVESALMTEEIDWVQYFGEEGAVYVKEKIASVADKLTAGTIPESMEEMFFGIVEAFPYAMVEYAANYHKVAAKIHEINPEALVILVGMYNPLEGCVYEDEGEELAIGDFMDDLIDISNAHLRACAMLSENTVFVEAEEVELVADVEYEEELVMLEYLLELFDMEATGLHPSENGHLYIAEQILGAIKVAESEAKPENPELLGDVNLDGMTDTTDAQAIFNYFMGITVEGQTFELKNADLDADGYIDTTDAQAVFNIFMGI